ncbi:MAG: efflux RND transporter periplasmic adaptor subunit, partial [Hyphomicrobiales bacterium]|nr:efflux RND transporter periplasmic adaptor subunit [Hyphomicrobiales bacterium]
MRLFVLIAALVGGAAVVYVFALKPTTVSIAAVTRGSAAEVVYATGTVEPEYWAKVTPLVRNRLVETCDCEGETVAEGHVLARLDDVEARAQLSELVAQEDYLHKETDRMIALLARGVVSTERYDDMSSKLLQAQALVAAQRERLADYTITAPLGGVVLRMDGEVGEVVEPGDIVAWVGRPKPLQVIAEVDEEDIPR